jgi:hypothetical protein
MPRYELKNKCYFVDAWNVKDNQRVPEIDGCGKSAHIADKRREATSGHPVDYLLLNDTAAFIARFIVMGVEINLIPQILHSEFGDSVGIPLTQVNKVLQQLMPYLDQIPEIGNAGGRRGVRKYQAPSWESKKDKACNYSLDFSPNWFGTGWFKI